MAQFQITYGLGGGYNETETDVIEVDNLDEANLVAYTAAMEMFESYGVFENQCGDEEYENDEDYESAYIEEAERWIHYWAEEISDG